MIFVTRFCGLALAATVFLTGCATVGTVSEVDPSTGYLATGPGEIRKAEIVSSVPIDPTRFKPLALVTAGNFAEQQVRNIGYFDEVINVEELQRRIVVAGLQDKVPSITDRLGLNNAARSYRDFLWIHYKNETRDNKRYAQLVATDPVTLNEVFVAETRFDPVWRGVNDQNTFYPLFNAMIDWLSAH